MTTQQVWEQWQFGLITTREALDLLEGMLVESRGQDGSEAHS